MLPLEMLAINQYCYFIDVLHLEYHFDTKIWTAYYKNIFFSITFYYDLTILVGCFNSCDHFQPMKILNF